MFSFLVALQFLTTLPVPLWREVRGEDVARSVRYFPLVGVILGLLLTLLYTPLEPGVAVCRYWPSDDGNRSFDADRGRCITTAFWTVATACSGRAKWLSDWKSCGIAGSVALQSPEAGLCSV